MLPLTRPFLLAAIVAAPLQLFAQANELSAVNTAFAGSVVFRMDKHERLVMDFFDSGNRFRQDIAPMRELDPAAVSFSLEEDAIVLKCLPDKVHCMTKEIFKLDVVRLTSRSTLPRPGSDPDGMRTIPLLQALLRAARSELVEVQDETRTRNSRTSER